MQYMGDLSINDFLLLKELASKSRNILEFGVGASTQIILNYTSGKVTSIDTSDEWIQLTKKNLEYLNIINKPIDFQKYENFKPTIDSEYDFVFNDGIDALRNNFGILIFQNIKIGGILAYHDTRRLRDIKNVNNVINTYYNEIDLVEINKNNSNITLIRKKKYEPYENWNIVEKKIELIKGVYIAKDTIYPSFYK
jgi:predicted O-methyltransferase YrrM